MTDSGRAALGRRTFLKAAAAAVPIIGAGGALSACSSSLQTGGGSGDASSIKIGYVSPETGSLAPFGEADQYVITAMQRYFTENPLNVGGKSYPVEIVKRDSQSDTKPAASHWSLTGLDVSGVDETSMRWMPPDWMRSAATSAARFVSDWLSRLTISTG